MSAKDYYEGQGEGNALGDQPQQNHHEHHHEHHREHHRDENDYGIGQPIEGRVNYGNNYGGGSGYGADEDLTDAARHAEEHTGHSNDSGIFSSVLNALGKNKNGIANQQIDEQDAVESHRKFFGGSHSNSNDNHTLSSGSIGSAAAMQALKMFTGGASGNTHEGNSQNAFVGLAMAEASKLFDKQSSEGRVASSASKESAVQQAGEMALKFYLQSQGKSGSSSTSGLLGIARKFL